MLAVALLLAAGARGSDGGLGKISEAIGAVQKYGHLVNIPRIRLKLSKLVLTCKIGFDIAEKEPSKVRYKSLTPYKHHAPRTPLLEQPS